MSNSSMNATIGFTGSYGSPSLIIFEKPDADVRVVSLDSTLTFGRNVPGTTVNIRVESPYVSRLHGTFTVVGKRCYYTDNHSTNGSNINGAPMRPDPYTNHMVRELHDGDVISVGNVGRGGSNNDAVTIIYSTSLGLSGSWKKQQLRTDSVVTIGRSADNSIVLPQGYVSRDHAVIRFVNGTPVLENLGSRNGVSVNNVPVDAKSVLSERSVIRICDTLIFFVFDCIIFNVLKASENGLIVNIEETSVREKMKKKTLIKDIHLEIEKSDFVLVLGGSGAGKSTLVKSILGRYKIKGHIDFADREAGSNSMAYVPQQLNIRSDETLIDVITDTAILRGEGFKNSADRNRVIDETLRLLGLHEKRNTKISKLSGGEKRRAVIANEVVTNPEVFFLDEPDSGLDPNSGYELMKQLRGIADNGKIVMLISHNYASYPSPEQLFSKVLVLAKSDSEQVGKLAFLGSVTEALEFFEVDRLSGITTLINPKSENGSGRADEFVEKYRRLRQ